MGRLYGALSPRKSSTPMGLTRELKKKKKEGREIEEHRGPAYKNSHPALAFLSFIVPILSRCSRCCCVPSFQNLPYPSTAPQRLSQFLVAPAPSDVSFSSSSSYHTPPSHLPFHFTLLIIFHW
jgi:hypothetical protein